MNAEALTVEDNSKLIERYEDRLKEKRKRPRKLSQALKVMSEISMYLKSHNIYFEECMEEDTPHITMADGAEVSGPNFTLDEATSTNQLTRKAGRLFGSSRQHSNCNKKNKVK